MIYRSHWCLIALICHSFLCSKLISGQQQQASSYDIKPQPATKSAHKIGLAPHERPACQLPPTISPSQRRHSIHENSDAINYSSNELAKITNPTSSINQPPGKSLSSDEPSISAPNVVSLPGTLNVNSTSAAASVLNNWTSKRAIESSERLRQLRQLLVSNNYDAYLVTPNDEHGSEYVSNYDRRLRFISGFTGSNGYALILLDRAVLFTDGRYELQADQDLDCNWWLVVSDEPLADIPLWLKANNLRNLKVATDARLLSLQNFDHLDEHLRKFDSEFALISQDLVDIVWSNYLQTEQHQQERPVPREPLFVHPLEFAGNVSWQEKVIRLADSMQKVQARHYVLAGLDDIAWLLNLRGSDIPMSPLFKAYLIVSRSSASGGDQNGQPLGGGGGGGPAATTTTTATTATHQATRTTPPVVVSVEQLLLASQQQVGGSNSPTPSLQAPQVTQFQVNQFVKLTLYIDLSKITPTIRHHLHLDNSSLVIAPVFGASDDQPGSSTTSSRIQVDVKDYDVFIMDFRDKFNGPSSSLNGNNKSPTSGKLLLDASANVAIHVLAKNYDDRSVLMEPLVRRLKATKNDMEVQGMRLAHWRDSLAISMLLSQLDKDIGGLNLTTKWTEIGASKELEFYRSLMDYNRGQSFGTISAYGANGAIIHYEPNENVARERQQLIGNQSTYLLDSGGQYLDGTTDITRTLHFGRPTNFQRETYTRVLMGSIDLMSVIFEQSDRSAYKLNDLLARRHLFDVGLDYEHGTGHGIGLFSMVHEAPWLLEHYASGKSGGSGAIGRKSSPSKNGQQQQQQQLVNEDPIHLKENMFTSVEPGYYKPNDFGIRLENIVVTQRVRSLESIGQASSGGENWLRFEPISLVPFEPKLMKFELLSNKQKAWLNSYNLMVRLRLTQQINHYLAKIRNAQEASAKAQQITGTASSSRLFRQLQQQSNQTTIEDKLSPVAAGRRNFLKMDGEKLQQLLEQTHRWVMQKTELIPLDVPQRTSAQLKAIHNSRFTKQDVHDGQQQDEWSALGSNVHGQRLMLAYMSALPFNDQEAAQLLAGRANIATGEENKEEETKKRSSSSSGKCTGFECDLWLLEALNSMQKGKPTTTTTTTSQDNPDKVKRQNGNSWPQTLEEQEALAESEAAPGDSEGTMVGRLMDMFKLNDAINQSASRLSQLMGSLWPLWSFGVLFLLQLALMGYVCRRGGGRAGRATSGQHPLAMAAPTATTVVSSNDNESNAESRFVSADFGQQVVI